MKVLTFTTLFPNNVQPNHGIFIMERMKRAADYCDLKVVAPVPFFPPLKINSKWYSHSQVTQMIKFPKFEAYYPRYLIIPKIGMFFYGIFLFLSTLKIVRRINKKFKFDLIDAHYIYPDGLAAILLGKLFRKPVILSARGTDINLYPDFFNIRPQINYTLRKASGIIAVCQALKDKMSELGVPGEKIAVIPNGVDIKKFYPMDRTTARKMLNLALDKKIILSVGNLIERKGFHFILKAMKIFAENVGVEHCPDLVIVGEGEYRSKLESEIFGSIIESKVRLVGAVSHNQLNPWYNACDVFCLASSREGWPNVLFEALACGKPVVATNVWGVSEVISSEDYGILIADQSPVEIYESLKESLSRKWDSHKIINYAQQNTWEIVSQKVLNKFNKVLSSQRN